jgi:hypothetical protein
MAIFRKVHTSFWSDSFVNDLTVDQKLFYIYILTNERTKQCGIYEITKKQICFDLGYSMDKVSILLKYFIDKKKIKYNESTKELAIKNWSKYNYSTSPKVKSCIIKELALVKDRVLIQYLNSIDTLSQEEQEEEQEEEVKNTPKPLGLHSFEKSEYYDPKKFKEELEGWSVGQLRFYYDALSDYSKQGNKYKDWIATARTWARKDEAEGKGFFHKSKKGNPNATLGLADGGIVQ